MNDQEIEKKIVTMIVEEALAHDCAVTVNNGGDQNEISRSLDKDAIVSACFASDSDRLIFSRYGTRLGWVDLVYGNGSCVISDYVDNEATNAILARANAYSDAAAEAEL